MDFEKMSEKDRKAILEHLRGIYKEGTRVELIRMDDPYTKIPKGTKGTVKSVDDMGTIHISWESGSSLGAVYGVDLIKLI